MFKPDTFEIHSDDSWDVRVAKRMHVRTRERLKLDATADPRMAIIDAINEAPLCKVTGALFHTGHTLDGKELDWEYDSSGYRIIDEEHPLPACLVGAVAFVCWGATSEAHLRQIIRGTAQSDTVASEALETVGDYWEPSTIAYGYCRLVYGTGDQDIYYLNDSSALEYGGMVQFLRDFVSMANSDNAGLWKAFMQRVGPDLRAWSPLTPVGQEEIRNDARDLSGPVDEAEDDEQSTF